MSVVTFISDLGYNSMDMGIAKAKFYSRFNLIPLVDIAHHIDYSDVNEAAFILRNILPEFPDQTIHLIAVKGESRKSDKLLIGKYREQFILAPDNGSISLAGGDEIRFYEFQDDNPKEKNLPFRLVRAAVALLDAHFEVTQVADPVSQVFSKQWPVPVLTKNSLSGTVLYTDYHGNAFTNIRISDIDELTGGQAYRINLSIHEWVDRIEPSTEAVTKGEISIIEGRLGYLVVTIHGGNAKKLLGLRKGKTIKVEVLKETPL